MAHVLIEQIQKTFGSTQVLKGVSVDITDGEFCVLVGPSGCGKSTLLRMIAGLEEVTEGTISIGGKVVNRVPPKERDIAMVFQNYALYPHMTVRDNMAFSLMLAKQSAEVIQERVGRASGILGLDQLLDRYPRQLSGGQRQRVAMGRAIVRDPQVFLFDEPLSNLDAKLRVQMRTEIRELHQRLHTTSVYVTHDQIEAMTMADKIVVMRDGCVEQIGPPLDLYDHPANQFVAGFIGSPAMNFIPVRLSENKENAGHPHSWSIQVEQGDTTPPQVFSLSARPIIDGKPGEDRQTLIFGVRPEHLSVVGESGKNVLSTQLVVVEPTGADTQLVARIGETPVSALLRERSNQKIGSALHLRVEMSQTHLFSDITGNRVAMSV